MVGRDGATVATGYRAAEVDRNDVTRIAVVGAGAAGIVAALAARGTIAPDGTCDPGRVAGPDEGGRDRPEVVLIDGQAQPGRKILISGGGRCNVTNEVVTADDFWTQDPRLVRNALRAFGVEHTRRLFTSLGVELEAEALGKLFPTTDRARDVLDALLGAVEAAGIETRFGTPVRTVHPEPETREGTTGWLVDGEVFDRVVIATGGLSVPATGSDGFGLRLAEASGHELTAPVPALAPLLASGTDDLAGLTVPVIAVVRDPDGHESARAAGSLLFTHKGVSGPAALDVSGAIELDGRPGTRTTLDLWSLAAPTGPFAEHLGAPKLPGCCLADPPEAATPDEVDRDLRDLADADPRATAAAALASRLPKRLAAAIAGEHADVPMGQVSKAVRRDLAERLARFPIEVAGTAGYAKAEVTRGGVPLRDLDRVTLESKRAPGMHLCGEVCDVTGRLGGFNFQWAWTSGYLAGTGAART